MVLTGSISEGSRRGRAAARGRTRGSLRSGGVGRTGELPGRAPAFCGANASFSSPSPPLAGAPRRSLPGARGSRLRNSMRFLVTARQGQMSQGCRRRGASQGFGGRPEGGHGVGRRQNWKMATEGGGRHSPSTVVWEEEGVLGIVQPRSPESVEPKVMDSAKTAHFPGKMDVRTRSVATRDGGS